jgi:hypothetical protein
VYKASHAKICGGLCVTTLPKHFFFKWEFWLVCLKRYISHFLAEQSVILIGHVTEKRQRRQPLVSKGRWRQAIGMSVKHAVFSHKFTTPSCHSEKISDNPPRSLKPPFFMTDKFLQLKGNRKFSFSLFMATKKSSYCPWKSKTYDQILGEVINYPSGQVELWTWDRYGYVRWVFASWHGATN